MNGPARRMLNGPISALAAAAAFGLASAASAQSTAAPQGPAAAKPPTARVPDKPPMLGNIVAGVVIVAAVVTASLIPSKRGHQD